jgi:hypothetical protein
MESLYEVMGSDKPSKTYKKGGINNYTQTVEILINLINLPQEKSFQIGTS